MSAVTRKGDNNTGHDEYPAVALNRGSSNVFVNGKPCGRKTDTYPKHNNGLDYEDEDYSEHSSSITGGSSSVFVNGLPVARVNDPVSCGGRVAQGSPNVYAN